MPLWMQWALIAAGLVAIVMLTAFIGRQIAVLKQDKARTKKQAAFHAQRREQIISSLQVLALAIDQDQVEYSEACLRIKGLLELIDPTLLEQPPYQIFQQVYDQLSHMPTHQARQDTDNRFVRKMDKERHAVEQAHAEAIRHAASALREHRF